MTMEVNVLRPCETHPDPATCSHHLSILCSRARGDQQMCGVALSVIAWTRYRRANRRSPGSPLRVSWRSHMIPLVTGGGIGIR